MVGHAVALPVEEDQVAGLRLVFARLQVQSPVVQRADPLGAVSLDREVRLRHVRVMQTEGDVHRAPGRVVIAVPVAVAGIAVALAFLVHDEVDRAFLIAQLGARQLQQVVRPFAGLFQLREGALPLGAGLDFPHRAGHAGLGLHALAARVGPHGLRRHLGHRFKRPRRRARRVLRLALPEQLAVLPDRDPAAHRLHAALKVQVKRRLVPAEAGQARRHAADQLAVADRQVQALRRLVLTLMRRHAQQVQSAPVNRQAHRALGHIALGNRLALLVRHFICQALGTRRMRLPHAFFTRAQLHRPVQRVERYLRRVRLLRLGSRFRRLLRFSCPGRLHRFLGRGRRGRLRRFLGRGRRGHLCRLLGRGRRSRLRRFLGFGSHGRLDRRLRFKRLLGQLLRIAARVVRMLFLSAGEH